MGCPYLGQQADILLPHSVVSFTAQTFFLETGNWRWALLSQVPGVCVTQVARARFLERNFNLIWCQGRVLTGGF